MADEITPFPTTRDPAAVIIPDERGFRVIVRGRPDLAAHEAVFPRLDPAQSLALSLAKECNLDFIVTAAALRKVTGR